MIGWEAANSDDFEGFFWRDEPSGMSYNALVV